MTVNTPEDLELGCSVESDGRNCEKIFLCMKKWNWNIMDCRGGGIAFRLGLEWEEEAWKGFSFI